jgi:OOP family OmpA-OmpF porin
MSTDHDKLKSLLLGEEIAQIKALQKLLEDQQAFTEKVSQVLDQAADQTIKNNPGFRKKFSRLDPQVLSRAIKANQKSFIDAMIPIMGPMIRQSVANAITKFVQDVNRAMELGFSVKALKWRWLAYRTGVSFAEIVFNNTIEYQVQQVFLIDKESGLLIEHAGHEDDLLQDKEAISAMLTAIEDFVEDSMGGDGSRLSAAKLGDRNVEVVSGAQANLAVVIKGAYTPRLVDHLSAASEQLHLDYATELVDENKWNNNPELKTQLQALLVTKNQSDDQDPGGVNFWPWLIILLLLIGWFGWHSWQDRLVMQQTRQQLAAVPGLVVQDIIRDGEAFQVRALKDPLADVSGLSESIALNTQPFVSLDDDILQRRAKALLNDERLQIGINQGQVEIAGQHSDAKAHQSRLDMLSAMPGISGINDLSRPWQAPVSLAEQLQTFLQQHDAPGLLELDIIDQQLMASGSILLPDDANFLAALISTFPNTQDQLLARYQLSDLLHTIEGTPLNFVNPGQLNAKQQASLTAKSEAILSLHAHRPDTQIQLITSSDCQGSLTESHDNNTARGNWVMAQMVQSGINPERLQVFNQTCEAIASQIDPGQIGVWFEVLP